MIAKYRGQFFCIDMRVEPKEIWAYAPVDGFEKKQTRRGTIYYEKSLPLEEIDEIFEAAFAVKWSGEWYGCHYLPDSKRVRLFTDSSELIRRYQFNEFEHGAWDLYVPIDSCEGFEITYKYYPERDMRTDAVSKEEWQGLWAKLKDELVPQS